MAKVTLWLPTPISETGLAIGVWALAVVLGNRVA